MLRRSLLKLGLATLAAGVAFGGPPTIAQEKPQVWTYWASGAEADALAALMKTASSEYPDADLAARTISGNTAEMRKALQVAFLGGNPPALYQSGMGMELKSFVDGGRLAPIDDVFADVDGAKNFPAGVRKVITFDNKVYGIPLNIHVVSNIFYNKKIFQEAGVTPPKTWDEFEVVSKKLKAAGYEPLANAGGPAWTLYNSYPALLSTLGKDNYYKLASGEIPFDSPEVKQALELFTRTYAANYMKDWTGYTWSEAGAQFAQGKVAMFQMGDWLSSYLKDAGMKPGEDYDFFPAPTGADAVVVQLDLLALTAGDKDAVTKAGKDFLRSAADPKGQEAFNLKKGSVAANQSTPSDKYDPYGSRAFAEVTKANGGDNVFPNLKNLLPVQLGDEFGTQLAAYAQSPSPEALDTMLASLEEMRQELKSQNAFATW